MMEAELHAMGVPKERVQVIPDEQESITAALEMGRRGDLLLIFADKVSRSWKQVIYFKPNEPQHRAKSNPPASAAEALPLTASTPPGGASDILLDGAQVIEDERGVRLAREQDD